MSYPGLPKVSAVAMEEPESMEVLRETAAVYEHVISQVQANCETTVTQLDYQALMSQFFAEWKARAFRLLQERAQAPPATVPVARPAVSPSAKRPRTPTTTAQATGSTARDEAPAKRAKPEDAGAAPARYGGATGDDDDDDDSSDSDTDGAAARGRGERRGRGGGDAELGPDLDDDDDTNFSLSSPAAATSRTASCVSTTT